VIVIALAIKCRISVVTRELQHADHAVIKTRMTRTANESSTGKYTLGDGQERGQVTTKRKEKKRKNPQSEFVKAYSELNRAKTL